VELRVKLEPWLYFGNVSENRRITQDSLPVRKYYLLTLIVIYNLGEEEMLSLRQAQIQYKGVM